MRSNDIIAEPPKMASSSMIDVCSAFSPTIQKGNSSNTFDVASYSRILQQVAKLYPCEHTSITASLPLNNASSSYHLPHYNPSTNFAPVGTFSSGLMSAEDSSAALSYANFTRNDDITINEVTPSNGERALDLSTQRGDLSLPPYRRITLDQVKHKLVEDVWVENDKKLMWKDSKIAAFNPVQKLFMCLDCEHVGFLSRVAEHWLGSHANLRVFHCPRCPYTSAWSRCVKMHLTRHHNEQSADTTMWKGNPLLIEVTGLMQELRTKVEAKIDANNLIGDKRFYCPHCPYATDRRDLYTRHENIHKDDKPFHCYVCLKQFNRADHVKKHFVRMHADSEYDITKIRKSPNPNKLSAINNSDETKIKISRKSSVSTDASNLNTNESIVFVNKSNTVQTTNVVQTDSKDIQISAPDSGNCVTSSMDFNENSNKSRRKCEKAFTCHYCNWSGSDNWCLKRHMNTHIKPFACVLCDYKAARAERLSTHVFKVHNKRICNKCSFLGDTQEALQEHTKEEHHNNPYSRRHICSACGMSFDTKANLETHVHLSHTRPQSPYDIVEITPIPISDMYQGSEKSVVYKENSGSYVRSENNCYNNFSLNDSIKDNNQAYTGDLLLACCPHCEYKLKQDEASKDHWLQHHEDVCGACVHVFTTIYGPQVWKKVIIRQDSTEKYSDVTESMLNNRVSSETPKKCSSQEPIIILNNSSCSLFKQLESTDLDRSSKRRRKQSYPKKIITLQENIHINNLDGNIQRKSRKRLILRCRRCLTKPKFYTIAQFKLHKMKRHRKRLKQSLQYRMRNKTLEKS